MRIIKKSFIFLICLSLTIGSAAIAADALNYADLNYRTINGGSEIEITGYSGSSGKVDIPSKIDGLPVTSIAADAFRNRADIVTVLVAASVKHIGDRAFSGTTWLAERIVEFVVINNVLIDHKDAGRNSLVLPDDIHVIGYGAFANSTFKEFTFNSKVTEILDEAFYGCSKLTAINIPSSVNYIGQRVFIKCPSLEKIDVNAENKNYASLDGVLYNKDITEIITCPEGKLFAYTMPQTVNTFERSAFYGCKLLTSVVLSDALISIPESAFYDCTNITSVTFGNSITEIGKWAFTNCESILNLKLPESLKIIGEMAFYNCSALKSVTFPAVLSELNDFSFINCVNLKSVTLGTSVTKVGNFALGFIHNSSDDSVQVVPGFILNVNNSDGTAFTSTEAFRYLDSMAASQFNLGFTANKTDFLKGDVNGNGIIEATDARMTLRASAELDVLRPIARLSADIDGDGNITSIEARTILRVSASLQTF